MNRYTHSVRLGVLIALALFLALTSLVPSSAAQDPPLPLCDEIAPSVIEILGTATGPIPPIEGKEIVSLEYSYRAPEQAWSHNPVPITFSTIDVPDWANAVLESKVIFVEVAPAAATEITGTLNITMTVGSTAPAYQRDVFHVAAEAEAGTCVDASERQADIEVTPGFLERWHAEAGSRTFEAVVDEAIPIPVTVGNDGNGPIDIGFRPVDEPENGELGLPKGLRVVETGDQAEAERSFDLQYKATEPGHERVSIQVFGRSADNVNRELTPETITVAITTLNSNGGTEELPLSIVPLLAALVGVGIAVTRFRR